MNYVLLPGSISVSNFKKDWKGDQKSIFNAVPIGTSPRWSCRPPFSVWVRSAIKLHHRCARAHRDRGHFSSHQTSFLPSSRRRLPRATSATGRQRWRYAVQIGCSMGEPSAWKKELQIEHFIFVQHVVLSNYVAETILAFSALFSILAEIVLQRCFILP